VLPIGCFLLLQRFTVKRISPDRSHTLRGQRNLEWFFKNRTWLRVSERSVHVAFAVRPRPEAEASIQFLFIAAKRDMRRAHDRNRAKRWLRAAVHSIELFATIEHRLEGEVVGEQGSGLEARQLLVMLRLTRLDSGYDKVLAAVSEAAVALARVHTDLE
jgi:ribonuclease P protein component